MAAPPIKVKIPSLADIKRSAYDHVVYNPGVEANFAIWKAEKIKSATPQMNIASTLSYAANSASKGRTKKRQRDRWGIYEYANIMGLDEKDCPQLGRNYKEKISDADDEQSNESESKRCESIGSESDECENGWIHYSLRHQFMEKEFGLNWWMERPKHGDEYSKWEAVEKIVHRTVKGTHDRRAMIKFMTTNKYIPNERRLYELIQQFESGQPITDGPWRTKGRPKKAARLRQIQMVQCVSKPKVLIDDQCQWKDGEFVRQNLRLKKGWKTTLWLEVTPICFCDNLNEKDIKHPDKIDICKYLGQMDDWCSEKRKWQYTPDKERVRALYFSPTLFKPPRNLGTAGGSKGFLNLKTYVEREAQEEGFSYGAVINPVICNGGETTTHPVKRFICKQTYECPFSFSISWDKYGFYIPLLGSQTNNHATGCPWHTCEKITKFQEKYK